MRGVARSGYVALSLAAIMAAGTAMVQAQSGDELIASYPALNSTCRGGSGDDPRTQKACAERDRVVAGLQQAGYCYGRRGQIGAQMSWHRCGADSLR
ncbi:exported hypothetical protein [Bosea sp. 62]|uniref:hypothetical protein n=1 Tax=unclassified Bosea (in: a-proteobacteria) TaxID=2653178 RepID=UPI0012553ACC|nr:MULTISPECIES: hypothetical protein [unclassified Bosea (in: a-proteobacteria)]CAD5260358.1 exported hypothetical protein [Bosea sp. 46]CAD5264865.1 exported hypothetical protein [Bosea sp. 21B]CAD5275464.1 exported hypothetical protein [Bosea sp. 7B]VVT59150.1 exported hypothetical protein [Bosea sp. EC-HK365B]VXB71522.1 exported hypothetical protein [Bosea sp. 29B]